MRRLSGFTLIELIIVIVLLGVVATVSVRFVALSTQGAIDVSSRQQRALAGVVISEQISRQLREALPTSVRPNGDGSCIEFIPIVAASNYLTLPSGSAPTSFEAVPLPDGQSASGRVVVYGYGSSVYNLTSPGPMSPPASMPASATAPVTVTFDSGTTHRFSAKSPEKRFYVVSDPVTLCQAGRFLYRYRNYGVKPTIGADLPGPGPDREVLAASLLPDSLEFDVIPPNFRRGAVVSFRMVLGDTDLEETTAISQEVQIRNVP
ncbi:PulJ/GspJ family protein [Marinobacter confluentis]|uniref:Type II secretion system protein n=1 Tax=Marinobacter confluentis TaxID=1697557 RepID=A0A4Z1CEW7_9GAMM|nr:type II secretion system protein [Marinobacter confluentis]TGN38541.1 type II secretion system protein [Marinobacter confluentis]